MAKKRAKKKVKSASGNRNGSGPVKGGQVEAEYSRDLGRRHRPVEPQLLHARPDGLPDAEHRPDREGGHAVHGQLWRAVLHGRPVFVHHRAERVAYRAVQGRHPGLARRHVRKDRDDCRAAERAGLRHRSVRQEPPRRPEQHAADQSRVRRVLRQSLSPECRGRAGDGQLPEGPEDSGRTSVRAA